MRDFGYDISDFTDIDETFGNLTNFKELLQKAKQLGLKVFFAFQACGNLQSDKPMMQTVITGRSSRQRDVMSLLASRRIATKYSK